MGEGRRVGGSTVTGSPQPRQACHGSGLQSTRLPWLQGQDGEGGPRGPGPAACPPRTGKEKGAQPSSPRAGVAPTLSACPSDWSGHPQGLLPMSRLPGSACHSLNLLSSPPAKAQLPWRSCSTAADLAIDKPDQVKSHRSQEQISGGGGPCPGTLSLTRPPAAEAFESLKNVRTPPSSTVQDALQCFFLGGGGEVGGDWACTGPGLRPPYAHRAENTAQLGVSNSEDWTPSSHTW